MAETKNTKEFYNSEIPSDWDVKKLGDIIEIKSGIGFNASEYSDMGIRLLQIEHVGYGKTEWNSSFFLPNDYLEKYREVVLLENDIVLALNRPVTNDQLKIAILKKEDVPSILYQRVGKLIVKDNNYLPLYLFYNFSESIKKHVERKSVGSDQPFISVIALYKEKVIIPPLPEQKAIAQVLKTADAAIHTTEKIIAQKELRKKWLMQQLLTGKKRLKGFDGEWKEKKLSDLFDRVTRKNTEGNTTVVTISAQRGFVRQTDFFNKNIASEITDNYFLVERGEFCYNKSYSNGYPWGATKRLNDFDKAVVTTLYICFGVKDEKKSNPKYFEQFLAANHLDRGLTKIAHEGGRAHGLLNVTPSDFFSLIIRTPSYEEQTAIAQVLQAADKEIEILKKKRDLLREQKKGLMQVLLTGKMRLKVKS
jgi:type I restriction enzyme, S subunit